MKKTHWIALFLVALLIPTGLCGFVNYRLDPGFLFGLPEGDSAIFFDQRLQNAGLIRSVTADTVVLGTSMAGGYRPSQIADTFGGTGLKISFPDGYMSEFDLAVDCIFDHQDPERLIFLLDPNILIRDESGVTNALPEYLYDGNPLGIGKYLFNKDILYYGVYQTYFDTETDRLPIDEAFSIDYRVHWSKGTVLVSYVRPEIVAEPLPIDTYFDNVDDNMAYVRQWALDHPETEFVVAIPTYSILQWDAYIRKGSLDATFAALDRAFDSLSDLPNVELHFLGANKEVITDFTQYGDHIHHSTELAGENLNIIKAGTYLVTPDNQQAMLDDFYDFVTHYDYESVWEEE